LTAKALSTLLMFKATGNKQERIILKITGKCKEEEEHAIQTLENNAHTATK